jgi:SAM-dependent methyltransferase
VPFAVKMLSITKKDLLVAHKKLYEIIDVEAFYRHPDLIVTYLHRARARFILELLRDAAWKRVADLGCGKGFYVRKAAQRQIETVGVDFFKNHVKEAHLASKFPNAFFILGDVENLPLRNGSFDLVILSETLEHVLSERNVLMNVHRILTPNGTALITVPNLFNLTSRKILWSNIISTLRKEELWLRFGIIHRSYSPNFLKRLVSAHNLKVIRIRSTTLIPNFMIRLLWRLLKRRTIHLLEVTDRILSRIPVVRLFGHSLILECLKVKPKA